ncbi:MAG TPA: hypothetical protein VEK84_01000, partial [Terriglobales bacterium]|nr:hypothetical protein [Terriglobales bacterium]
MLLAIFTLLLLTAMGLSLLCAADLETNIAANYRDKQVSLYSALSGLQEARDRLIPSRCATDIGNDCNDSIAVDTRSMGLPTLGDPNGVLYIINPSNGETVKPWDPNNPYFDNELCQEHALGLTPAYGTCPASSSSVPSGTDWFNYSSLHGTTYNDSQAAAGEYQPVAGGVLPFALPYKWVRITVKTDNMTKAPVVQGTPTGSVVCWDGKHQVPIGGSTVYNSACENVGGIQLSYNGTLCSQQGKLCTFNPPI